MKNADFVELANLIIDNAKDAFIVINRDDVIIKWSKKAESLFGWSTEEALGQRLNEKIVPERWRESHKKCIKNYVPGAISKIIGQRIQITALHKNGQEIQIELTVSPIIMENGECYFSATIRDNLEQILYENDLKQLVALLDLSRDSIVVCDIDDTILFWNKGAERLYGFTSDEAIGQICGQLVKRGSEDGITQKDIREILFQHGHWEGELNGETRDGKPLTVHSRWNLETNTHGDPTRILITNTDITEQIKYQEKIQYLATHDVLTSLSNRVLLDDRLDHAIKQAKASDCPLAVLFMDLNRFKNVNDSMGHDKGDLLLQEIAKRIRDVVGESNTVARLGGDEFVAVIEHMSTEEEIFEIAERLITEVEKPINICGYEVSVSTSIGGAVYPKDGDCCQELLKNADAAMYTAKEIGAGAFRFYSVGMNDKVFDRLTIENALHRAIERKEFVVYYQPRIDAATKQLIGVEALVRWNHPVKGILAPGSFIALAEEIGIIHPIGEYVLREACTQNKKWQDMGLPPFRVSVNLSVNQFDSDQLSNTVKKILEETGLEGKWLELEITESSLMKNIDEVSRVLTEIRKMGPSISIDDFGTGYSSLQYLKKLPIDTLKIDKSFIEDLGLDTDDDAIVTATIAMAHSMNMHVVAEGVTTTKQVDFLIKLKCNELQGFLFSRPFPPELIEMSLKKKAWF